jgi:hypothetical protein
MTVDHLSEVRRHAPEVNLESATVIVLGDSNYQIENDIEIADEGVIVIVGDECRNPIKINAINAHTLILINVHVHDLHCIDKLYVFSSILGEFMCKTANVYNTKVWSGSMLGDTINFVNCEVKTAYTILIREMFTGQLCVNMRNCRFSRSSTKVYIRRLQECTINIINCTVNYLGNQRPIEDHYITCEYPCVITSNHNSSNIRIEDF